MPKCFYSRPELAQGVTGYPQLSRYDIGFVRGSAYFEPFDSDAALRKVGVASEGQLLDMLRHKRLQMVIGTDCQVDYELLRDPHLAGRIVSWPIGRRRAPSFSSASRASGP
ncbi:hypothetical protein D3C76_1392310 [compost metagenome]